MILLFVTLITTLGFSNPAQAAATDDGSPNPTVESLKSSKEMVLQSEVERRRLLGEIYKIQRQIRKYGLERGQYEHERRVSQKTVTKISHLISKLEPKIQRQRGLLKSRIRALSKFGGQNWLRLVFSSQNPAELDRNMRYLKVITNRDYLLLTDYRRSVQDYRLQQVKLSEATLRLAAAEKKFQSREVELDRYRREKGELLQKIDAEKLLRLTQLKRLRLEATKSPDSQIGRLKTIESVLRPSFFEMKGQLSPPVAGSVVQGFGDFHFQPRGITLRHKGIFWSASRGSSIRAVYPGTVKFAGWLNQYERVVIVSHGDHYYSIYGSLDDIRVKVGTPIEAQTDVGTAGSSPFGFGTGTYFEVRHFSEPLNPIEWITSSKTQTESRAEPVAMNPSDKISTRR